MGMAGTISRSMEIFRESLGVLKKDKEMVLFPIISSLVMLVLTASFFVPAVLLSGVRNGEFDSANPLYYVLLFLFYLVGYFVVIFFNTGLIACAHIRRRNLRIGPVAALGRGLDGRKILVISVGIAEKEERFQPGPFPQPHRVARKKLA